MKSNSNNEMMVASESGMMIFTDKSKYVQGELVKIVLRNTKSNPVRTSAGNVPYIIYRLGAMEIDAIKADRVSSDADCEAPFSPASMSIRLDPGDSESFEWDQKERWCELKKARIEQVKSGKYRIETRIENEDGTDQKTIRSGEFSIL